MMEKELHILLVWSLDIFRHDWRRFSGYKDKDIFELKICLLHDDMVPQYKDIKIWLHNIFNKFDPKKISVKQIYLYNLFKLILVRLQLEDYGNADISQTNSTYFLKFQEKIPWLLHGFSEIQWAIFQQRSRYITMFGWRK